MDRESWSVINRFVDREIRSCDLAPLSRPVLHFVMARSPDRAIRPTEGLQSATARRRRPPVGAVGWSGDQPTTSRRLQL